MKNLFLFFLVLTHAHCVYSQDNLSKEEEDYFNKQVKSIEEFVSRFNMEKDIKNQPITLKGNEEDKSHYQTNWYSLIDNSSSATPEYRTKCSDFFKEVFSKKSQLIIDGDSSFAIVDCSFKYETATVPISFVMKRRVGNNGGYRWTIISAMSTSPISVNPKDKKMGYLDPQNHNTNFINLGTALRSDKENIATYADPLYRPDYLSIVFFLIRTGKLEFLGITNTSFVFFNIENYLIEIKHKMNKEVSETSGWLISDIKKQTHEDKKKYKRDILGIIR